MYHVRARCACCVHYPIASSRVIVKHICICYIDYIIYIYIYIYIYMHVPHVTTQYPHMRPCAV